MLGYTREEILCRSIPDVIAAEEVSRLPEEVAMFAGGTVVRSEWRFRRKDGSFFTGEVLGRQLADGRIEAIVRDISERKKTEEELCESESFYRQTLESIPGMVFTTRPDGYCDYQSQQWVEFTGVPMNQHLGDGWNKLLHPDDRPRAFVAWRDAVEGRAPYDTEYRVRRHDGIYEWFKVRARPIRNSAGEIVRWFGTALNIDDLIKAQAELQRSQRLYRAIGESIDYGIWVCEPDGRNTYASESFLKLVGMTQEQCSSFGWGEVLHPDDAERTIAAWKECVRTGGTWDIEHRFRGVDGQWHPILARGVPVRDDNGQVLCWVGINLDISRPKRTEEHLRASLQEKEVLMQEIHHRVKNNLQVISSLINLQADTLNQPVLRRSLDDVRDRIRTMALVHEKLYQSGDLARLNFADYAASLLHYLWRAHGDAAAKVRLTLATQPVTLPVSAAVSCGLILNELATNALKHAFPNQSEGEVTVDLAHDPTHDRICLQVSDNGLGLPAGLNWRQSRSLGLRLVQMLATQIDGTVEVGSGPGTEFRVAFSARTKR
jgi:PAS domain S-box-containing protein